MCIRDSWKTYVMGSEEIHALRGVSIQIERGEYVAIMGPSGSGKSTLMNLIGCLDTPSKGTYILNGKEVSQMNDDELARIRNEEIGFVFQTFNLLPRASALHNVELPLVYAGISSKERLDRARASLEKVELGARMNHKPNELSGGQRQRVALARSLVKKPKLLLLDEPLAALDKKLREHTQFELINIQETLGVTFVVVTHDQEEAMTLSTRIGLMNHGEIVQVGTPSEIYEYPNSRFVSEFIGSVNMFEGRLVEDEPSYVRIGCDDLEAPIYVDHRVSSAPGATVWAAIRPEKITISREKPDVADNWATAVVRDIAYMGDMSIYLLRLDSGKVVRVTQPNIYRHADDRITWDERVYLQWYPESPVVVTK